MIRPPFSFDRDAATIYTFPGVSILLTRRLVPAGEVFGIQVLDHIIIGDGGHFSFRDSGMIARTL